MRLKLKFRGGCLDGEYEFDDADGEPQRDWPEERMQAWCLYSITKGQVKKCAKGLTPHSLDRMRGGDRGPSTAEIYCVVSREEVDGMLVVTAEMRPEKAKA